jgi:hypothetical protein
LAYPHQIASVNSILPMAVHLGPQTLTSARSRRPSWGYHTSGSLLGSRPKVRKQYRRLHEIEDLPIQCDILRHEMISGMMMGYSVSASS